MEYNAWGNPPNPPEHEANLVFTRMLAGPIDFTPGVLSLQGQGRPADPVDAREAARELRRAVQPDADGRGPARELRAVPGAVPVHQGRADRLGARRACSNGEVGDYVDHRAQGSQQRRLVSRQRHGRERAHARSEARLPRCRTAPTRADLSRRRRRGLERRNRSRSRSRARGDQRGHADAAPGAGRRTGDSLPRRTSQRGRSPISAAEIGERPLYQPSPPSASSAA